MWPAGRRAGRGARPRPPRPPPTPTIPRRRPPPWRSQPSHRAPARAGAPRDAPGKGGFGSIHSGFVREDRLFPDDPIQSIPLDGAPPRFPDHLHQLLAPELLRRLGPRVVIDALLLHRAVEVVGAEGERRLRGRDAELDPVRLDMWDVVEGEPRHRDLAQIVGRRGARDLLEIGVVGVKRQRDESLESAGLVLQRAQTQQMIRLLLRGLDVAVEHRAVGLQAGAVRRARDLEPARRADFEWEEELVHSLREDLGAAPRERAEPRFDEVGEDLLERALPNFLDLLDLHHREGLHVDPRARRFHRAHQIQIIGIGELGIDPGHHVDLGDRLRRELANLRRRYFRTKDIGPRLARQPLKRTEAAELVTNIRIVDVLVDVEIGAVAVERFAAEVRERAERVEVGVAVEQHHFIEREAPATEDFLRDGAQPRPRRDRRDARFGG